MAETNTLNLLQDSLLRRMRTMHSLYYQAVDTMDLEHVNHFERPGVLPIAFSLFHYTNMQDATFMFLSNGEPPIWNEEWQGAGADGDRRPRQGGDGRDDGGPAHRRLRGVQGVPAHRVRSHRGLPRRRSTRPTSPASSIAPPYPDQVASTYSARCAGPEGITVLDGFECWHYQHGLRHMGEIELARGLVGLGGMTS